MKSEEFDKLVVRHFDVGMKSVMDKYEVIIEAMVEHAPNKEESKNLVVRMFREIFGIGFNSGVDFSEDFLLKMRNIPKDGEEILSK